MPKSNNVKMKLFKEVEELVKIFLFTKKDVIMLVASDIEA